MLELTLRPIEAIVYDEMKSITNKKCLGTIMVPR